MSATTVSRTVASDALDVESLLSTISAMIRDKTAEATGRAFCSCNDDLDPDDETAKWADSWFDRSICPEPCGSMHNVCVECGRVQGFCPVEATGREAAIATIGMATVVLAEHRPAAAGASTDCNGCSTDSTAAWPCPSAALALHVLDPSLVDRLVDDETRRSLQRRILAALENGLS